MTKSDEPEKIDEVTFYSPINKENSFGEWNVAKRTKSTMTLYYYRDTTGYIEWDIPKIEETVEIGITFEFDKNGKRTLTDYDGVFAIPRQALDLLEKNGVDVADMRKAMKD
jgi:hypothetical protein